jgi:hypothetical protein
MQDMSRGSAELYYLQEVLGVSNVYKPEGAAVEVPRMQLLVLTGQLNSEEEGLLQKIIQATGIAEWHWQEGAKGELPPCVACLRFGVTSLQADALFTLDVSNVKEYLGDSPQVMKLKKLLWQTIKSLKSEIEKYAG